MYSDHDTIRMRHPETVAAKMAKIRSDGLGLLHIVCDFDKTMTRYYRDSHKQERNRTTWDYFDRRIGDEAYAAFNDIAVRDNINAAAETCWKEVHAGIVALHVSTQDIVDRVRQDPMTFRDGIVELLAFCNTHGIPFLVFSAGIGNIIRENMYAAGLNIPIVANDMILDERGVCIGFEPPLVHACNKHMVKENRQLEKYTQRIHNRQKNMILLGDALDDIRMAASFTNTDTLLSIGFLNAPHYDDAYLTRYLDTFDIVVLDDSGIEFLVEIFEKIE